MKDLKYLKIGDSHGPFLNLIQVQNEISNSIISLPCLKSLDSGRFYQDYEDSFVPIIGNLL